VWYQLLPCVQLDLIYGKEGSAALLARRPAVRTTPPATLLRSLAAMALIGVSDPVALAARSPVLLQVPPVLCRSLWFLAPRFVQQ
jgi:hypothetical protein